MWDKKREKAAKATEKAPKKRKDGTYASIRDELDGGQLEIEALGLMDCCHVLRLCDAESHWAKGLKLSGIGPNFSAFDVRPQAH